MCQISSTPTDKSGEVVLVFVVVILMTRVRQSQPLVLRLNLEFTNIALIDPYGKKTNKASCITGAREKQSFWQ